MIPIVASLLGTLAQNGLGLLSSAIQAKGKEVVENALGVKISDNPSDAEVAKLIKEKTKKGYIEKPNPHA